jgi:hypothetical protein
MLEAISSTAWDMCHLEATEKDLQFPEANGGKPFRAFTSKEIPTDGPSVPIKCVDSSEPGMSFWECFAEGDLEVSCDISF